MESPDLNLDDFTHVRMFHSCRPVRIEDYLERGLRLFTFEQLAQQFYEIFSDIPREQLEMAVKRSPGPRLPPRIDAVLDPRYYDYRPISHYAEYGSETILGFTNSLPAFGDISHRDRLRQRGRPAVLILEAPIEELESDDREELVKEIADLSSGNLDFILSPGNKIDFTVSFHRNVSKEWIVDHQFLDAPVAAHEREVHGNLLS